jgi:hypothetical protein
MTVPSSFAISRDGEIAVADAANGTAAIYSKRGRFVRIAWRAGQRFFGLTGVRFMPDKSLLVCTGTQLLRLRAGGGTPEVVFGGRIGGPLIRSESYGSAWIQVDSSGAIYWVEERRGEPVEGGLPRCLVKRRGGRVEVWRGIRDFAVTPAGRTFVVGPDGAELPRNSVVIHRPRGVSGFHLIGASRAGVYFTWTGGRGEGLGRVSGVSTLLWDARRDIMWPGERLVSDPEGGIGYWIVDYHVAPDGGVYAMAVAPQRRKGYVCILELSETG